MRNFILSKKEAVIAGGCFLSRISVGLGEDTQSWLPLHAALWQHSGSSQSTKPSTHKANNLRELLFLAILLPILCSLLNLTFVVIFGVIANLLFQRSTVRSIPSIEAFALPMTVICHSALAMTSATSRATFQSAVSAIPARNTKAGSILALPMVAAASVTKFGCAKFSRPTRIADARLSYASPMYTTIQIANLCKIK